MKSEFNKWFEAQFGKDPLPGRKLHDAVVRYKAMRKESDRLFNAIERSDEYRNKRTAALYAWNAARSNNG